MRFAVYKVVLPVIFAASLSGCLDRSDHYSNVNEAREGRVFEKGWLPDILPESAYDLKVITTVESSAGRGRFRFDPNDYRAFSDNLLPYDGAMSKIDSDNRSIRRLLDNGYEARTFSSRSTSWVFLCDQKNSVCEFFVWQ